MNRPVFGTWGLGLDDGSFAQALAALGVLQARLRVASFPVSGPALAAELAAALDTSGEPVPWRLVAPPSQLALDPTIPGAQELAEAWRALSVRRGRARLAVEWDFLLEAHASWILEQLSSPAVGAHTVFLRQSLVPGDLEWHWPLRVGLLDDAPSRALLAGLQETPWAERLVRFVNVASGAQRCDLLLLPYNLRTAVVRSLEAPVSPRASGVVVLRGFEEPWGRAQPLVAALHAGTEAAGVTLTRIPPARRPAWFHRLVEELAHNAPLDAALFLAGKQEGQGPPLIFATEALLDAARTLRTVEALRSRVVRMQSSGMPVEVPPAAAGFLNLSSGLNPPELVAERLEHAPPSFAWSHEGGEASAVAELAESVEPTTDGGRQVRWPPRWIQAQVLDLSIPASPRRLRRAFRRDAPHAIDVRIGGDDRNWITAPSAFPVEKLPPAAESYELTVVFSEPRLASAPQVARVTLPIEGDSSNCRFYLQTSPESQTVEARITVLHGNRVLQVARLHGVVVEDPAAAPARQRIRLPIESVVRPGFADLGGRPPYHAAFILNHDADNVPGVTRVSGDRADYVRLDSVEKPVGTIGELLSEVAASPEDYATLESEATRNLLWSLALHGADLYSLIVTDRGATRTYTDAERIQVVAAKPEAYLPLEFLYDRPPPDEGMPVCWNAREALSAGRCPDTCPKEDARRTVVCPLGFWGPSRSIERHAYDPESAADLRGADFALQPDPGTRTRLDMPGNVVYAASDRVDAV